MSALVDRLRSELKRSTEGGGEKYVQRHMERGKLLPRERVEMLLDEGSYFLEIAPLAGIGFDDEIPGARVIGGIGLVSGRECMIIANEATAKGGSTGEAGLWKNARLADIARENRLTSILLVESAGADLPVQSKIFVPGGRGFREITRRSKLRIPTISVVFGSSTAGGAYLPGMSDYVVMVKKQAQVFLAGPPLVKMATGEVSTEEELGGAEMHSRVSGLSDYLAEDELDGIRIAREIVANFNLQKPPTPQQQNFEEPLYDRGRAARNRFGGCARAVRSPRSDRAHRRWIAFLGVQERIRADAGHRIRAHPRISGGHSGQQRRADVGVVGQGRAVYRAVQSAGHSADVSAEHHRLHGRQDVRGAGHHSQRREADQRGFEFHGARPSRS